MPPASMDKPPTPKTVQQIRDSLEAWPEDLPDAGDDWGLNSPRPPRGCFRRVPDSDG